MRLNEDEATKEAKLCGGRRLGEKLSKKWLTEIRFFLTERQPNSEVNERVLTREERW